MYVANHFSMSDPQIHALLGAAGAADLVTAHEHGLVATFLPFVFDPDVGEHGTLIAHVARNNRQWIDPVIGEAMVIVHGPDHYISPRWMPSFAEHGQVVPTWNYLTVHAYGRLIAHDDPAWTEAAVRRLTGVHEQLYSVDQVPADYVERQVRAIVGIEVQLTRVEAKAKMSQNKLPDDVSGVVHGLRDEVGGERAEQTAAWMQEHSVPTAERREALLAEVARTRRH
ncbi:MAG: FMN-binding negative transcriptional regulator [Kineosporiaceae bacterium]